MVVVVVAAAAVATAAAAAVYTFKTQGFEHKVFSCSLAD